MSVLVQKLLWFALNPLSLLLLAMILGLALRLTPWRRVGRWLSGLSLIAIVALSVLPFADWLMRPLEHRFPPIADGELPDRIDGIVVLGGSFSLRLAAARRQVILNDNAERITAFIALARRYPQARLVFTGGSGELFPGGLREADLARRLFEDLGFDADRVIYERESRITADSPAMTRALVQPAPDETWLLVTSAFHMPRSIGVFRRDGWRVLAYPVDYRTLGRGITILQFNLANGPRGFLYALREWTALVVYYWRGWTDALFPAP